MPRPRVSDLATDKRADRPPQLAVMRNQLYTDFVARRVGNYQYNPQWGVLVDQLWVR